MSDYYSKRPAPDDFSAMAATMTRRALCAHYRTSNRTILRWFFEKQVPRKVPVSHNRRPIPDDFATIAPTMTHNALSGHYGCMRETVSRWMQESGIACLPFDRTKPRFVPGTRHNVLRLPHGHLAQTRVTSLYDDAADVLRRERFPVNRCNDKGVFDFAGKYWRVGWSIISPEELLQRAAKYRKAA